MNRILFIITGSIAATKCEEIIRKLKIKKYKISCILTEEAKKYSNVKNLKKILHNQVFTDKSEKKNKMLHITLSRVSDIILVCPATANSIAKFANGYANNLASNTLLASNKKILFVPAMNSYMWSNKANKNNIKILKDRGHEFIGPEVGQLKCGEYGLGRISSTEKILNYIKNNLKILNNYKNKRCLVTAGPTIEMIDPVRYLSNKSSGKQGYEIASQLAQNGAEVILISGPTRIDPPTNVKLIKISSADEMFQKIKSVKNIDVGFFAAAVSDYKKNKVFNKKLKKKDTTNIHLVKNIDILENIGKNISFRPKILVGFAAETGGISLAKKKLIKKNCDIIIYNKINDSNKVFDSDYNKISIITKKEIKSFNKKTKVNCAKEIINYAYKYSLLNE